MTSRRLEGIAQPVAEELVEGVRMALVERLQRRAVAGADATEQVRVIHRTDPSLARGEDAGAGSGRKAKSGRTGCWAAPRSAAPPGKAGAEDNPAPR